MSDLNSTGNDLMERVQDLVKQGNMRRLVIRTSEDKTLIEVSLTIVTAGLVLALLAGVIVPVLILAVIAAVVARARIEIVREITDDDDIVEYHEEEKEKDEA